MTNEQRRKFWAMVGDITRQVVWEVNGEPTKLDKESWRLILCAGFTKEQRTARGIDGGYVMLGMRLRDIFRDYTPEAAKAEAADLITMVQAFGDQHEVKWSDPEEAARLAAYEGEHV